MGRADGLARAGGQRVRDLARVRAFQVELFERGAHQFRGLADLHAIGRGQIQRSRQTSGKDVRGGQAGLAQRVDAIRGLIRVVDGVGARLDGGGAQLLHVVVRRLQIGLDGAHALVEVGGQLRG